MIRRELETAHFKENFQDHIIIAAELDTVNCMGQYTCNDRESFVIAHNSWMSRCAGKPGQGSRVAEPPEVPKNLSSLGS